MRDVARRPRRFSPEQGSNPETKLGEPETRVLPSPRAHLAATAHGQRLLVYTNRHMPSNAVGKSASISRADVAGIVGLRRLERALARRMNTMQ